MKTLPSRDLPVAENVVFTLGGTDVDRGCKNIMTCGTHRSSHVSGLLDKMYKESLILHNLRTRVAQNLKTLDMPAVLKTTLNGKRLTVVTRIQS